MLEKINNWVCLKKNKDTNRSVLFRKYGNVVQKCVYCNVNKLDWIELVWQEPSSKGNLKGTPRQWIMTVNIRHIHNYLDPFPPINLSSTQSLLYKVEQLDLQAYYAKQITTSS